MSICFCARIQYAIRAIFDATMWQTRIRVSAWYYIQIDTARAYTHTHTTSGGGISSGADVFYYISMHIPHLSVLCRRRIVVCKLKGGYCALPTLGAHTHPSIHRTHRYTSKQTKGCYVCVWSGRERVNLALFNWTSARVEFWFEIIFIINIGLLLLYALWIDNNVIGAHPITHHQRIYYLQNTFVWD